MAGTRAFGTSRSSLVQRLLRAAQRGVAPIESVPIYTSSAWSSGGAVSYGDIRYSGSRVYGCLKSGTSGSTPISGTGAVITDGTAIWTYMGERVAIAWATNLTVAEGQVAYNGGYVFRAANAGSTAASGSGPTPGSLTDNGVTWLFVGEQTQPLVSAPSLTVTPGLTQGVNWNDAKITYLGGSPVQVGANPRATIPTVNYDGGAGTSRGSVAPNVATVFEGVKLDVYSMYLHETIWVDGEVVALVVGAAGVTTSTPYYVNLDWTNARVPRKARTIRVTTGQSTQFYGFRGAPVDTFTAYAPHDPLRVVLIADSFGEGVGGISDIFGYPSQLQRGLGIEDFVISAAGGTGVLKTNGSRVAYKDRFTVDVINRSPNVVIIQSSQNDADQDLAAVKAELSAEILRVKTELPDALCVVMGVWNTRAQTPLIDPALTLNNNARDAAAAAGVPFVDWSDLITGTGRIDSQTNNGNADFNVLPDGTHPTVRGHALRARLLISKFIAAWRSAA